MKREGEEIATENSAPRLIALQEFHSGVSTDHGRVDPDGNFCLGTYDAGKCIKNTLLTRTGFLPGMMQQWFWRRCSAFLQLMGVWAQDNRGWIREYLYNRHTLYCQRESRKVENVLWCCASSTGKSNA